MQFLFLSPQIHLIIATCIPNFFISILVFYQKRSYFNCRNSFSIVHSRFTISAIRFPSCTVASQSLQFVFYRARSLSNLFNSFSIVQSRLAISAIRFPSCMLAWLFLQFAFPRARSFSNLRNSFSIVRSRFAISAIPSPLCMVASLVSLQFHLHRAQSLCNIICNSLSVVHAPLAILF